MKNPFRTAAGFLVGAGISFTLTAFTPAQASLSSPQEPQRQETDNCYEDPIKGSCCSCGTDGKVCCVKLGPIQ